MWRKAQLSKAQAGEAQCAPRSAELKIRTGRNSASNARPRPRVDACRTAPRILKRSSSGWMPNWSPWNCDQLQCIDGQVSEPREAREQPEEASSRRRRSWLVLGSGESLSSSSNALVSFRSGDMPKTAEE